MSAACPACGSPRVEVFHEVPAVPVNSVLSLESREEAVRFERSDIRLGFCDACGFIANVAFDRELLEYSERYDPTQAFSATFNRWHRALAEQLIDRHGLRGRHIVEIGCGKGEFLALLCELGDNRGVGFDPAFARDRLQTGSGRAEFVADFYSERYGNRPADFVCCKMTLEHIDAVAEFVSMVRRTVGNRPTTTIFFQVPDARRILEERAFWDVYYEHCSYFSAGSLGRLFRRCGFDVLDLTREFGAQYVTVDARPAQSEPSPPLPAEDDLDELRELVRAYARHAPLEQRRWRSCVRERASAGQRVVLWGSGSKGVAFLTTLGLSDEIDCVVDINPFRQGKHMLGTGHLIVGPDELRERRPDVVIVMNPVYRDEIAAELARLGVAPEVWTT